MGAWGTSLYANDSTCDLRADYVEKLKDGKSNLDATQELLVEYQFILNDPEESALFWFALADTQWNYGRLLPEVKEKALFHLANNTETERWEASGAKKKAAWEKTLFQLQTKLLTPQPREKKVLPHRSYHCQWNLGDTFAYCLRSEYSKTLGCYGRYVAFRKVSEDSYHPKHIVPVIQVYFWMGDEVPTLDILSSSAVLPSFKKPQHLNGQSIDCLEKKLKLISESEKDIPKDNLVYIGNLIDADVVAFQGHDYWTGYPSVGWEDSKYNHRFEHYVIDMYLAWNDTLKE